MKFTIVATNPRSCGSAKIPFIVVVAFQLVMMAENNGRLIGWVVLEQNDHCILSCNRSRTPNVRKVDEHVSILERQCLLHQRIYYGWVENASWWISWTDPAEHVPIKALHGTRCPSVFTTSSSCHGWWFIDPIPVSVIHVLYREWHPPPRFRRPTSGKNCTHIEEYGQEQCSTQDKPNVCLKGEFRAWPRQSQRLFERWVSRLAKLSSAHWGAWRWRSIPWMRRMLLRENTWGGQTTLNLYITLQKSRARNMAKFTWQISTKVAGISNLTQSTRSDSRVAAWTELVELHKNTVEICFNVREIKSGIGIYLSKMPWTAL